MKKIALALISLGMVFSLIGCFGYSIPTPPKIDAHTTGIVAPPNQSGLTGVSKPETSLVSDLTGAVATGNHRLAKGINAGIQATGNIETNTGLRWLLLVGVVLIALGVAVSIEFTKTIGGCVMLIGAALVGSSLLITAILPYMSYICAALGVGVGIYILVRYKPMIAALEAKTSAKAKALEAKIPSKDVLKIDTLATKVETDVKADVSKVETDIKK
jgi:hypothetical protein